MTILKNNLARCGPWAIALGMVLATDVLAQTAVQTVKVAGAEDMRLWSFGDCDRRYPYVKSAERNECVRVVGSAEARDARALRVCEVSHEKDPEEIERCKAAYQTNKENAARDGVIPNGTGVANAPPSPEMMRRVKAITAAAVEQQRAAASAEAPGGVPDEPDVIVVQPEASSPMTTVSIVALVVLLVGLGAKKAASRKEAASA